MVGSGHCQAVDQLLTSDVLPSVHSARCIINPIDSKARFPAFNPRRRTLTYDDIVIEHVDFCSSIYTHCIVVRRQTQYAAQIQLSLFSFGIQVQCIPVICTALGLMRRHAYIRSMLISEARAVVGHNDIGLRRTRQHTAPAPPTPFPLPNTLSNGTHDGFNHYKYNTI